MLLLRKLFITTRDTMHQKRFSKWTQRSVELTLLSTLKLIQLPQLLQLPQPKVLKMPKPIKIQEVQSEEVVKTTNSQKPLSITQMASQVQRRSLPQIQRLLEPALLSTLKRTNKKTTQTMLTNITRQP